MLYINSDSWIATETDILRDTDTNIIRFDTETQTKANLKIKPGFIVVVVVVYQCSINNVIEAL